MLNVQPSCGDMSRAVACTASRTQFPHREDPRNACPATRGSVDTRDIKVATRHIGTRLLVGGAVHCIATGDSPSLVLGSTTLAGDMDDIGVSVDSPRTAPAVSQQSSRFSGWSAPGFVPHSTRMLNLMNLHLLCTVWITGTCRCMTTGAA